MKKNGTVVEGELVRFRIEPAVKDKVSEICEKLGFDLAEVLRAFMTHVAQEGTLPFDMGAPATERTESAPFAEYTERLWRDYRYVDGEVALALLWRFIADCAARIDAQSSERPKTEALARLSRELQQARELAESLDLKDADAVGHVLATYAPLVASLKEEHGE